MTAALPGTVVIIRPRHPLHGRELRVLGRMRRHGVRELLVEIPDGSKRLIPASWTDLGEAAGTEEGDGPATLGPVTDLLGLSVLVSALCARSRDDREQAARKPPAKEDDRAACAAQSDAGPGAGATPGPDRPAPGPAGASGYDAASPAHRQGGGRRRGGTGGRR